MQRTSIGDDGHSAVAVIVRSVAVDDDDVAVDDDEADERTASTGRCET